MNFENCIITSYTEDSDKNNTCACCGRKIKNVYTFEDNENNSYSIGTECTKTLLLSKEQEKTLSILRKDFKSELSTIKKMDKIFKSRLNEFGFNLFIKVNELKNYPFDYQYSVELIAPSRFKENENFVYNRFFFKTDSFRKLTYISAD